jgi:hypothetical protein
MRIVDWVFLEMVDISVLKKDLPWKDLSKNLNTNNKFQEVKDKRNLVLGRRDASCLFYFQIKSRHPERNDSPIRRGMKSKDLLKIISIFIIGRIFGSR